MTITKSEYFIIKSIRGETYFHQFASLRTDELPCNLYVLRNSTKYFMESVIISSKQDFLKVTYDVLCKREECRQWPASFSGLLFFSISNAQLSLGLPKYNLPTSAPTIDFLLLQLHFLDL